MDATHKYYYLLYPGNHPENIREAIKERQGMTEDDYTQEANIARISFIWKPTNYTPLYYAIIDKINSSRKGANHIVLNHFENLKGICTKNALLKSLKRYYHNSPECITAQYHLFLSTPTSYIIQSGCEQDYAPFIHHFKNMCFKNFRKEFMPSKHCEENVWLVKPSNQNQGKGIEIFRNYLEIQRFIESKQFHSKWVVQKYIEKPMLYDGRKFDIRIWALISSNGNLYYYRDGYLRTSSDNFTLDKTEKWVHLTNNCFQCNGEKYGTFESGNTLSFDVIRAYLKKIYPKHAVDFDQHIIPRIKDLIIDTFLSVKSTYNPKNRKNCFELLGYDFMIDEDLRVWLIECNENPYIGIPNEYIKGLLPIMLSSMLSIVLDPVLGLQPKYSGSNWELLYSEKFVENKLVADCNQRRPFTTPLYPIKDLAPPKNECRILLPISAAKTQYKITQNLKKNTESASNLAKVEEKPKAESVSKQECKPVTLMQMTDALMCKFKEKLYDKCCTLIYNKLIRPSSFTLAEVGDAISCLHLIYKKHMNIFASSRYCIGLLSHYLDYSNIRLDSIHDMIMELVNILLKELLFKRVFFEKSVIFSIKKSIVSFCNETQLTDRIKQIVDLVFNMGNFDKINTYIPGLSAEVEKQRMLFLNNGLLILLYHFKNESKSNDAITYVSSKIQNVDSKAFEKQLEVLSSIIQVNVEDDKDVSNTLREYNAPQPCTTKLSILTKKNSSCSVDYGRPSTNTSSNEMYRNIAGFDLPKIYQQIYGMLNEINEKSKQKNIETIKWKQLNQAIMTKKIEEERKQKEEIKVKALQTLFQRYEDIKKRKQEQKKIENTRKEELMKLRESKRKEKIDELKKKEIERKRLQEYFMKKRAEKEKSDIEELQKIAGELRQKKAVSMIKKRYRTPLISTEERPLPSVDKEMHRSILMNGKNLPNVSDLEGTPRTDIKPSIRRNKKRELLVDDVDICLFRVYNSTLHKSIKKKKFKNLTANKNSDFIFQV